MDFLWGILLQTDRILTPNFGILGLAFSILLLVSPKSAVSLSNVFNRSVDIDGKITYVDRNLKIGDLSYTNNIDIGICLTAGSVVSLFFLFFGFEPADYAIMFFLAGTHPVANELIFPAVIWCLKTGCMIGIVIGLFLIFSPVSLKDFEDKMNSWFETQPAIDKTGVEVDAYFFRHPITFGIIGLSLSILIILLSIIRFAR